VNINSDASGKTADLCRAQAELAQLFLPANIILRAWRLSGAAVSSEVGVRAWTRSSEGAPPHSPGSCCNHEIDISKVCTAVIRTATVSEG